MTAPTSQLFDERGILIEERDILRVYHYRARRRREHVYMYKQVRKVNGWLVGHHLCEADFDGSFKHTYNLVGDAGCNRGKILGTRVVQSVNWRKLP